MLASLTLAGWERVTCGSRYKSDNVPNLYLNDRTPKLNANWNDNANPKWGAPSCGSVEIAETQKRLRAFLL